MFHSDGPSTELCGHALASVVVSADVAGPSTYHPSDRVLGGRKVKNPLFPFVAPKKNQQRVLVLFRYFRTLHPPVASGWKAGHTIEEAKKMKKKRMPCGEASPLFILSRQPLWPPKDHSTNSFAYVITAVHTIPFSEVTRRMCLADAEKKRISHEDSSVVTIGRLSFP